MKTILIMYMPGHAGNFLARLFSLGNETVPQLPVDYLDMFINTGNAVDINRMELYSFRQVKQTFDNWQDFHRKWADYYQHEKYKLLNLFYPDRKNFIVHSIHPHEFVMFESKIQKDPEIEFYAVHLDSKYNDWVTSSQQQLNFVTRPEEREQFDQLNEKYHMSSINLDCMIESDHTFLEEYSRVCKSMELSTDSRALDFYHDWKQVRL